VAGTFRGKVPATFFKVRKSQKLLNQGFGDKNVGSERAGARSFTVRGIYDSDRTTLPSGVQRRNAEWTSTLMTRSQDR